MGAIVDRAERIADEIRFVDPDADPQVTRTLVDGYPVRVSTDIRDTVPPCLLVVPIPRRDYAQQALGGAFEVAWQIVALGHLPADLESARALEELVDVVAGVLDIETAEPASYGVPGAEEPLPAYLITHRELVTPTED